MKKAVNRLSVLFLLLLGVLPQIALLAQSMDCGVHGRLWLWMLGAALCLWVSACFRRGMLLGMPASAALLYAAYRFFDVNPLKQLDDLVDRFSGAYYNSFLYNGSAYQYQYAVEDHSFLLLLIAFLLMAYLSSALTSSGGRRFMSLLGSVPLPTACLAVNGRPPYAPVVAMLLFWALVLAGGDYEVDGGSGKTVFGLTFPVLVLLVGIFLACDAEHYDYEHNQPVLAQQLEKIDEWFRHWLEQSESPFGDGLPVTIRETQDEPAEDGKPVDDSEPLIWEANAGGMDLTQQFDRELLEKRFFSVKTDVSGTLYLRAVSYGDYLGTGWAEAPKAPCSSLGFTAQALQSVGQERSLSIRMAEKLRWALVPYYSVLDDGGDAGIPGGQQPGRMRYYSWSGVFSALTGKVPEEAEYRSFAHEVYTRLPAQTRSELLTLAAQAGLDSASPDIVGEVAAYIRGAGVYDIETGAYLSDDYAVCFLTQAQRGCCVHFATAAVAMYRALGIPARMTEGFLVYAERDRYVEVKGAQAHAWAEVYLDGLGWVPVEVTGQGGLDRLPEETAEPAVTSAPEEAPVETAEPTFESGEAEPSPAPLPIGIVQSNQETEKGQAGFPVRKTLRLALLILLLLSVLPIRRRVLRAIWRRRLERGDPNRRAVAIWKRSRRAARFGGSVPAGIENCAEKAYFSAGGITEEELSAGRAELDRQIETLDASLSPLKRFVFRYLYVYK